MTGEYHLSVHRAVRPFRVTGRPVLAALLIPAAVLVAGLAARPAGALDAGPSGAAAATQDGWWNRLQGAQEGEPENPVRPLVPPAPAPPTIPGDTIVAGAALGQQTWVAAVGIEVALPPGGLVDALTLRLKESPSGGANLNPETAKVSACPAVIPWGPAKNAAWRDRPEADCTLASAEGVRAEDGTWSFDLTGVAQLWTDPFAPLAQNGVVLSVDPAASPGVTQVAWLDYDSGNVIVELLASVVPEPAFGPDVPPATAAGGVPMQATEAAFGPTAELPPPVPVDAGPLFTDPFAFTGGGGSFLPPLTTDVPVFTEPETPAALAAAPQAPSQPPGRRAQPAVGFWENVPAAVALLAPVALGLALLVGLALGPSGRPLPVWGRAGGLSRALARRSSGGNAAV